MGQAHDGALDHPRKGVDLVLHFLGIDVVAARDDQVLGPADDGDVARSIDDPEVAGDEEAVGAELRRRLLRHSPIAAEDVGPAHLDHADLAGRQRRSGFRLGDPHLDARQRRPH